MRSFSLPTSFSGLLAIYILAPLPVGANIDWVWLLFSTATFVLVVIICIQYLRGNLVISRAISNPINQATMFFLGLVVTWQAIQAMPLSSSSFNLIPSTTAELYRQAYTLTNNQIQPEGAISVDASLTLESAVRSAVYFSLYVLLLILVSNRNRLKQLCYALIFSGFFQAFYGSFMTLSGMEYLLGVKKQDYIGYATGTFVNRNHFAGYLEMTLAIGIGLLMVNAKNAKQQEISFYRWRSSLRKLLTLLLSGKAILRLMLVIMVTGLILSRSRMGNGAFFNSLIITGVLSLAISPQFRKKGNYLLLASLIAVDVLLLGSWFGLEKVVQRIEETSLSHETRYEVDQDFLPMLDAFDGMGSGAGTFSEAYPAYVQGNYGGYDHAHNDYLELLTDLGYIGFGCLSMVVLLSLWNTLKALRHPGSSFIRGMGFAGLMGTLSLLIHSAVDFNLQIPANAMTFVLVLAIPGIALSIDKPSKLITA